MGAVPNLDRYGRRIDYLRISVTDRCNLACIYCMPEHRLVKKNPSEILTFEEIERIVKAALSVGITNIRITGGEPLMRKNLAHLVSSLAKLKGITDLSLTTNGTLLAKYAEELARAGLNRVNISLDSLDKERYRTITRGGELEDVLRGIEKVLALELLPVKINVVLMFGLNDDEIDEFISLAHHKPLEVRFIELMPLFGQDWERERFVPLSKVRERCQVRGNLQPWQVTGNGPAQTYRLNGSLGTIGFISPLTQPFCSSCNRLRLTADGRLRPCLHSEIEVDLKETLREERINVRGQVSDLIREAIKKKPKQKYSYGQVLKETMCQIGG